MRFLVILLLAFAWTVPGAGPARAQPTADQLNRLSLEALTTPAPGGNPGPSYGSRRSYGSHRAYASPRSYRRYSLGRGYQRSRRGSYRSARYAGRYAGVSSGYHRSRYYAPRRYSTRRRYAGGSSGYSRRGGPYIPDYDRPRR